MLLEGLKTVGGVAKAFALRLNEDGELLVASPAGAGGGAGDPETDLSIVLYRVKTAFTGASVGDTVSATRAIQVVDDVVTQVGSTLWRNESTDAVLASAPAAANLEVVGATGLTAAQLTAAGLLTDTQLRAAALDVATPSDVIAVTPVLDTAAYATGDVLFNPVALTNAARINGGRVLIQSITLLDKDDQGVALDLFLLEANNSFGTINVAPTITDANAEAVHFIGSIATADWIDLGANRVASLKGIGLQVEAGVETRDLFLAAVTRGAPTHTASGIVIKVGILQL